MSRGSKKSKKSEQKPRTALAAAIARAMRTMGTTQAEYAARVGITAYGLQLILSGKGVRGATLARLQRDGGVKVTPELIDSLAP